MTVYHVYMRYSPPPGYPDLEAAIFTFTSRYLADEFFRAFRIVQPATLQRETPQFWSYDPTGEPGLNLFEFLRQNAEFKLKVIVTFLTDRHGQRCPTPPLVDGKDWVNGGTFSIRKKRESNLYWAANPYSAADKNPKLIVSLSSRSKFRVCGVDPNDNDRETVLIRDDTVTVTLVITNSPWSQTTYYVAQAPSGSLIFSTVRAEWKFGDFFTMFGTVEHSEGFLVVNKDLGDEWEFC